MENISDFDMKNLFNGLTEGRELAKQLQIHLNVSSSSHKTREVLVEKILNSYDQALSILNYGVACAETQQGGLRIGTSDSPRSNNESPRSDGSDHEFKDQDTKEGSKKRKAMPRWTQKVQVAPGTGEAHVDGYSWRKYGQKDILGATYSRGYYRCTHRHSRGCLATKQVQRSDDDPTILEVAYKGMHTCSLGAKKDPKTGMDQEPNIAEKHQQILPQPHQNQPELLLDFQTKDLDTKNETLQPLNNNPSSSSSRINPENDVFSAEMMDTDIYSSSFMSTEPNYLTFLPSLLMNGDYGSSSNIVHTSESDAQTVGIDYPFGQLDLDSNFPFDNPTYFP